MLMIYQQRFVMVKMRETIERVLSIKGLGEFHRFGFDAGQVGMVFISRDQKRIAVATKCLRSWLGPVASARIIH
jgi:hypothetical protein